jgi:hypothetical protein
MRATSMMTQFAGKVASKRYGDDTPNILEANFIRKLATFTFATSIPDDELHSPNT